MSLTLRSTSSTLAISSPDHEHQHQHDHDHDLEASSDHDTPHITHTHSHTHIHSQLHTRSAHAHAHAQAHTLSSAHAPAGTVPTPTPPPPPPLFPPPPSANVVVRSVRRSSSSSSSRWWYVILCLSAMVLIIMYRMIMIGPLGLGWLSSSSYGGQVGVGVGWNAQQKPFTLDTHLNTQCWGKRRHVPVPPFPTHTRNITRQLEWIDRYDTSPFHGCHTGIIITFVNMGFIDMTLNWLCHIRALQISSYLIIAMDQDAFHAILKWDPTIHVYLWNKDIDLTKPESIADPDPSTITSTSSSTSPDPSAPTAPATAFVFNDGPFVDMMVRRLRFTIDMLRLWPHPIIFTDTDIILLQDILSDFVSADGDVVAQDDSGIACAGQILFRPTENVLLMLEDVLSSTISRQYHNEQLALHAFLHNPQYQSGGARALKFHLLPKLLYPSGDVVWGREKHQERVPETRQRIADQGWLPASVHNNWIMTKQVKTKRFQEFGMWQVDDVDQGTCTYDALSDVYMPPSPRLNIHILAYKRVNSLKRLLTSLATSHYDSRQINVTLHVDSPADRSDTATMTSVEASVKAFRDEWEWKYGHKILRQRQQHVGQNTQYYEIWEPPMSNDEVIIVLQDDEIMSPYWYTWLRKAIDTYYGTDPYMYGISLQRQYFVPGSPGTGPNPPTSAAQHEAQQRQGVRWKRDNRPLLYQQLGTWGQVFFPAHYRLFQSYTEAHRRLTYPAAAAPASASDGSTTTTNPPAVPVPVPVNEMDPRIANLWSNGGYQGDVNQYSANGRTLQFNDVNWEYWFMAFTAEYGVYTMYTDFSNEKALLINNQEAGDHYATDAGPDAQLMNSASWNPTEHMQFPDISQQVVYDFWMKPVEARAQLSIRNMMMHKYWKDKEQKHLPQLPKMS